MTRKFTHTYVDSFTVARVRTILHDLYPLVRSGNREE